MAGSHEVRGSIPLGSTINNSRPEWVFILACFSNMSRTLSRDNKEPDRKLSQLGSIYLRLKSFRVVVS